MIQILLSFLLAWTSQTDQVVTVKHVESIAYPSVARDAQIQGKVEVEVSVSPEGDVVSASAISGHPALKPAAEENIRRWRFDRGATRRFSVTYSFSLEEPGMSGRSETRNAFDLPSLVRVVTNLPVRTD